MSRKQQGFTLIELMIVVAIIGILAAVAIPAYTDYIGRSQVSEGPTLMDGVKQAVEEWMGSQGAFPSDANLTNRGARLAGKYVSSLSSTTTSHTITVTMKAAASGVNASVAGQTFKYVYNKTTGIWSCTHLTIQTKYLPTNCN